MKTRTAHPTPAPRRRPSAGRRERALLLIACLGLFAFGTTCAGGGSSGEGVQTSQTVRIDLSPAAQAVPAAIAQIHLQVLDSAGVEVASAVIDLTLGDAPEFAFSLTPGNYVFVAQAFDAAGNLLGEGVEEVVVSTDGLVVNVEIGIAPVATENDPTATITSPLAGDSFTNAELIAFAGTVADPQGIADVATVVWTSTLDGPLDSTAPAADGSVGFSISGLTVGVHLIRLRVTDAEGNSTSDSVQVTITAAPGVVRGAGPVISAVSPPRIYFLGGTDVAILGFNFQEGATVRIGALDAPVRRDDPDVIVVDAPPGTLGSFADVTVRNPDGTSATLPGGVEFVNELWSDASNAATSADCSEINPCHSIQQAIDLSTAGTLIHVADGTYRESLDVDGAEDLTIVGDGHTGGAEVVGSGVQVLAAIVNPGASMHVRGSSTLAVERLAFRTSDQGIRISDGSVVTATDIVTDLNGTGVLLEDWSQLIATGSVFSDNSSYGVYLDEATADIDQSELNDNGNAGLAGELCSNGSSEELRVDNSQVLGNDLGLAVTVREDVDRVEANGNTLQNTTANSVFDSNSNCLYQTVFFFRGNDVTGGSDPMSTGVVLLTNTDSVIENNTFRNHNLFAIECELPLALDESGNALGGGDVIDPNCGFASRGGVLICGGF